MLNARRVLSKAQILDHVWEYDFDGDANVVETYISLPAQEARPARTAADPHGARRRLQPAAPARGLTLSLRARLTLGLVALSAIGLGAHRARDVRRAALVPVRPRRRPTHDGTRAARSIAARTAGAPGRRLLRDPQPGRCVGAPGRHVAARRRTARPSGEPPARAVHGRRRRRRAAVPRRRANASRTATRSSSRSRSTTCSGRCDRLVFVELVVMRSCWPRSARSAGGSSDSGCGRSNA